MSTKGVNVEAYMKSMRREPIMSKPETRQSHYLKTRERKVPKSRTFRYGRRYFLIPGSQVRRRGGSLILSSFNYGLTYIWNNIMKGISRED